MSIFKFWKLTKINNPLLLLLAYMIAKLESDFNPNASGSVGEIGLFQIRKEYYDFLRENPTIDNQVKAFRMLMAEKVRLMKKNNIPINLENLLRVWNGGIGNMNSSQVDNYIKRYQKAFPYLNFTVKREM